jgi:MoaA/NifB/PqqE/SkfB family radical SAM enzyme
MEKETLQKIVHILPLTREYDGSCGLFFSCLYEPTIHPRFIELIKLLPVQYKNSCFFTTNLVKHISDDDIRELALANVAHINISLETFDNEKYKTLTSVSNSCFFDNLKRLISIFSEYPLAPKIRFITMILKDNYSELIEIAKRAHELSPYQLEFRTPFYFKGAEKSQLNEMLLSRSEIDKIVHELNALNFNISIWSEMDIDSYKKILENYDNPIIDSCVNSCLVEETPHDFYGIRIEASGEGYFMANGERFDINCIEHPFLFFSEKLLQLAKLESKKYEMGIASLLKNKRIDDDIKCYLDEIIMYDKHIMCLRGWVFCDDSMRDNKSTPFYVLLNRNDNEAFLYKTKSLYRPDIAKAFNDQSLEMVGFETLIDIAPFKILKDIWDLKVAFYDGEFLRMKQLATISKAGVCNI